MADFYFKAYLDICIEVNEDIAEEDEFSFAYNKLEQALKLMDKTEGITLEDVEIK